MWLHLMTRAREALRRILSTESADQGSTPRLPAPASVGDFTADRRLALIAAIAVGIGAVGAVVALLLIRLIALLTNLFYFHRASFQSRSPTESGLGALAILVPVAGGILIGLIARYGSERIRGHGIPEAMEAILIGRSLMQPKVAVLKPVASAIAIGSGGPFGAEGPIIMTGGAVGSIVAQAFALTASERKTLLVAGAAAGMSATFATPLAAALLSVELLLFEWKPRSVVPVALAAAVAAILRPVLLGPGPLFPVPPHPALPASAYPFSLALGLAAGGLSVLLTVAVYAAEDAFKRVPLHWMWWPAIGGLAIGIGGWFEPRALGIGYDVIGELLHGHYLAKVLLGLIVIKALIWSISLGSGSSGGVLAPLLMMGGALGALASGLSPGGDRALWPLVSMAAVLGGTMRSPFTAVVFALELTRDIEVLPALLIAAVISDAVTVLVLKRSILTEKVARRGYHVSREYSVDPLEVLSVGEVMTTDVQTIPASLALKDLLKSDYFGGQSGHQGYPVVDAAGELVGVLTRSDLLGVSRDEMELDAPAIAAADLVARRPIVAYPGETCRTAAERMAKANVGRLPVVSTEAHGRLVGIVTRSDLLKPRARRAAEEAHRERFLGPPAN